MPCSRRHPSKYRARWWIRNRPMTKASHLCLACLPAPGFHQRHPRQVNRPGVHAFPRASGSRPEARGGGRLGDSLFVSFPRGARDGVHEMGPCGCSARKRERWHSMSDCERTGFAQQLALTQQFLRPLLQSSRQLRIAGQSVPLAFLLLWLDERCQAGSIGRVSVGSSPGCRQKLNALPNALALRSLLRCPCPRGCERDRESQPARCWLLRT